MSRFSKNQDCPRSERLLAFQVGDTEAVEGRAIRAHMTTCEFCEAEVEFYAHYPPVDEQVIPQEIPHPLYELAAALLSESRSESKFSKEINRLYETGD